MDYNPIYKNAEDYVSNLFEKKGNENILFHTLQHTKTVVARAKEIAAHYNLSEKDMLVLFVAAWFHDTGHLYLPSSKDHEDKSVDVMKEFMAKYTDDESLINEIAACIMATKEPRSPATLTQEIICDADTYHFGTKEFNTTNKNMRAEYNAREERVTKAEWDEMTIKLLQQHKFYTSYCKGLLEDKKKSNIKKVKKSLKKHKEKGENLKIDETNTLTTKGIQTMLRLTSENHLKLSDMADHKANILISVNAIIISVILSVLVRKLDDEPYLTIPTIFFLLIAVATIVLSILSTRPKVTGGDFSDEDVTNKKTNLLFFGNFYKAPFEKYDTAMRRMMKDSDYLYGSLIKDIYYLGVVLGRKYRLIRIAYYIFMIGIVVAVLAFAIAIFFFSHTAATTQTPAAMPL